MNNNLRSIGSWLFNNDHKFDSHVGESFDGDFENFLENLLWEQTSLFVDGTLQKLLSVDGTNVNIIKYFSYPFYSHYKALEENIPPWLTSASSSKY